MKIYVALILILALNGCQITDDFEVPNTFIGKWNLTEHEVLHHINGPTLVSAEENGFSSWIKFKRNGEIVYVPLGDGEKSKSIGAFSEINEPSNPLKYKLEFQIYKEPSIWLCNFSNNNEVLEVESINGGKLIFERN